MLTLPSYNSTALFQITSAMCVRIYCRTAICGNSSVETKCCTKDDAHAPLRTMCTKKREREAPLGWVLEIVPTDLAAIFVPAPPASLHVNDEAIFGIAPLVYVVRSCAAVVANRQWLQAVPQSVRGLQGHTQQEVQIQPLQVRP